MINKELKLKYIKSLKSGGRVPKYQTAWGKLDKQDKLDDWTRHWQFRTTPLSNSKILGGWKPGSRNGHAETDKEYTARRTKEESDKSEKETKWMRQTADMLHAAGVGLTTTGLAGSLALAPVTTIGGLIGGVVGEKAVDKGLESLAEKTGSDVKSWKDLTQNYLGWSPTLQMLTNPGTLLGGGVGAKGAQLGKGAMDYLIAMDMARYGHTPTTRYYFKPGYLGVNGGPIGKVPEEIPLELSPSQISDGRWVINDPDNPGKRILWNKYLERTGQLIENKVETKNVLPFKHKFSNNAGKVWDKQDIVSYIRQQIRRNPTNLELEDFIRSNGLEEIRLPNGGYGILEQNDGSIFNGINDIINPPRPVPKAERVISLLGNLGLTLPQSGKFGYTLDVRNGLPRYSFLDLFSSKGKLRGGQEAFNRMRPSFSGEHGKTNWTPENDEERVSAILRTHFNGNPGETATDAYTGKIILNPDGSKKVLSPIQAIIAENPYGVSGTYSNAIDGEFSLDSYILMLKNLRRAKVKGLNLERTRYNTLDDKMNPITYSDTFTPNEFSTKISYNTDGLSQEYQNILRNYYKGSSESLIPRTLPKGTTVKRSNNGLEILYNGKSQGYITKNSNKNILKILTDEISETNKVLGLKGDNALSLPIIDKNGVIKLSNPQFVIFNKGGKINNGIFTYRSNKSNFND